MFNRMFTKHLLIEFNWLQGMEKKVSGEMAGKCYLEKGKAKKRNQGDHSNKTSYSGVTLVSRIIKSNSSKFLMRKFYSDLFQIKIKIFNSKPVFLCVSKMRSILNKK